MAIREVLLDRDSRAPEILSVSTISPRYFLRRCAGVFGLAFIDVASLSMAIALARLLGAAARPFSPVYFALAAAVLVSLSAINGLYGMREQRRSRRRRAYAAAWFLVATVALNGAGRAWAPVEVAAMWLVTVLFQTAGRELFDGCLRLVFGVDLESKRTIVLGSPSRFTTTRDAARRYSHHAHAEILGIVADEAPSSGWRQEHGVPTLGRIEDIEQIVRRWHPDQLLVVDRDMERHHLVELADLCRHRRMTLKLADLEMRFGRSGVSLVPGLHEALFVAAPLAPSGLAWVLKRWTDVAVSVALLVLASPLLAVVALAIKLTSPGPVLYAAERVGLGQQPFRCLKFRTMRADAESMQVDLESLNEADGAVFKIRSDPRVTPLGRRLRALSIDELPQLINVLRGEMSLVGPRPLPLRDNELLETWHRQRHVVLPGLTGLWQVSGRSDTSFAEMIRLDLEYVDSWSVWLDLSIAWRTPKAITGSRGAY